MSANRYYSLNDYCKEVFGEKVYRLSLSGGMTCPNRDGTLSYGGCAFCSAGGSGDFAADAFLPVSEQFIQARQKIAAKTHCQKFIAYFQSFTNTYAPVDVLRQLYSEAMAPEEIVALSIGTRSDCLPPETLELLSDLNQEKPIWIELGLQSIHAKTLSAMNTHTTVAQFDAAVSKLHALGISVIAHVILGFPGETKEMMKDTVRHVAALPVSGIKLQLLHVLKHTDLADFYRQEPFYIQRFCDRLPGTSSPGHGRSPSDGRWSPQSITRPVLEHRQKTHFKHHSSPSQRTQYQTRRTFLWLNHLQSINLRSYIC